MADWLNLYWSILLPLAALLPAWSRLRLFRAAWRRGLLSRTDLRWLTLSLTGSLAFVFWLWVTSLRETALWPAIGAGLAAMIMAWGTRQAARGIHPGLRGFLRPLPRDGLELIEWETPSERRRRSFNWAARSLGPALPAMLICAYVLWNQSGRWPGIWMLTLAPLGPWLIIALRRLWLAPLLLLPMAVAIGWRSFQLRQTLPPGDWHTPMTSAACTSRVYLAVDRTVAWCADEAGQQVYRFEPWSGRVTLRVRVESAAWVLTGEAGQAWILQNPVRGLIHLDEGEQSRLKINLLARGAVDQAGRLWLIDLSDRLYEQDPSGGWRSLDSQAGLLANTAYTVKVAPDGTVWVGSIAGASYLPPDSPTWYNLSRRAGLPGPVKNLAFAPDGTQWFLWEMPNSNQGRSLWGVSGWKDGAWEHVELGGVSRLDSPVSEDALAVDGLGRVWFVAPSYMGQAAVLGVLTPGTGQLELFPQGAFVRSGLITLPPPIGVVDDDQGGVFLYNPSHAPLRHWRP